MSPFTQVRGDGPNTIAEIGPGLDKHTEPSVQSSPRNRHVGKDWRPAFETKKRNLVYSSKVLQDQRSISNGMKMGEAYHECHEDSYKPQDMYSITSTGKGYFMKAMTPSADFDASRVEEAQKERMKTLERRIRDGEKSRERYLDEIYLLRNGVAPCRGKYQRATIRRTPDMQPRPAAKPSITHDEMDLNGPESPKEDGFEDGDSGASTLTSATDAAQLRSESERGGPSQKEQQQEEEGAKKLSRHSLGSLTDLKQSMTEPVGMEEAKSRLEELKLGLETTKPGLANRDEGEEASPSQPSQKKPVLSLLDFLPLSNGSLGHPSKSRSPVQETAQRYVEDKPRQPKSMVRDPGRRGHRHPTAAEKGKSVARCTCPRCQPRRTELVRFDPSAMDKAEDGPGLSHEGFIKRMRDQRRMMEADPRGEGCSSWAMAGTGGGLAEQVGLGMFTNPRPAPRMPHKPLPVPVSVLVRRRENLMDARREGARRIRVNKREISQPMEQTRHDLFQPAAGGHSAAPAALQGTQWTSRRKAWGALLSKRLTW